MLSTHYLSQSLTLESKELKTKIYAHSLIHSLTFAVGVAPPHSHCLTPAVSPSLPPSHSHCLTPAVGAAPPQPDQLAENPALAAWASQIRKRDDESPTASPPGAHNLEQALMVNFESAGDTTALRVVQRQMTSPCLSLYHSMPLAVSLDASHCITP